MPEHGQVRVGDAVIAYEVVRSRRRRKTIELRVEPGGGVRVAAPLRLSREQVRQVVERRARWLLKALQAPPVAPPTLRLAEGERLPYLGRGLTLRLAAAAVRRAAVRRAGGELAVTLPAGLDGEAREAAAREALLRWYRRQAAEVLAERVAWWAPVMGRAPARVLVRQQRRRWGSCGADGTLRFNWRLVLMEPELLDYVVIHELAHLHARGHGADFWRVVARHLPDFKERRRRLDQAGRMLPV